MKIEHIAMYVNELEATKNFFVKYLNGNANDGYHNKNTGFRSYFISFDDGARLEIMKKPEMTDEKKTLARTGFIHVAFSVGSKEAVDALTARIGQSSITESKFMDEDFLARHRSALVASHNLEFYVAVN